MGPTALYLETTDRRWEQLQSLYPNAERPDISIERYIRPEEFASTMSACLTDEGFEAEPLPDGGVKPAEVPEAQRENLEIAVFVCGARFPYEDVYSTPLDENQIGTIYDYYTGELTTCLLALGYQVDVSAAPSRDAFIETYGQSGVPVWSPYDVVLDAKESSTQLAETQEECPQSPPSFYAPVP